MTFVQTTLQRRRASAVALAGFPLWQVERNGGTAIFRQIHRQIGAAILAGALPPGSRLPSTRVLAEHLAVARASVVSAYEQLLAEGYVAGRIGSGTYVSADIPLPIDGGSRQHRPSAKGRRALAAPRPKRLPEPEFENDVRPFSIARTLADAQTMEAWRRLSNRALRAYGSVHFQYADPRGLPELRQVICDYVRATRAVRCEPAQIIVTAGTQQAMDIAIRALLRPGDEVLVEEPCYPLAHSTLAAAGMTIRYGPVDAQGFDIASGLRAAGRARAAFVTPSHQFPLGVVMSMARRLALLTWARETGAWIIEDDHQSEFRYAGRPLASLQALDEADRVIYVGSLNKVLFPGLRIGYAVLPPAILRTCVQARHLMDRQPPSLSQSVLTEFMREGHLAGHIRRMRLLFHDQRDTLIAQLSRQLGSQLAVVAPDQGMHFVGYLAEGRSDVEVEQAARRQGVVARALGPMYRRRPRRSGLLFGFAGHPRRAMPAAVARLARAFGEAAHRHS
jgi:GntR family transcriptional regulator/MocR family aminotransferase